jgi:hypothetical protein
MAALAQAETTTTHFGDTLTFPDMNPCTGATVTGRFVVKGSDGSRLSGHFVAHITLHPDGTVTVEFEKERMTCP